jgi:polysaccharide export outer membrane protein
MNKISSVAIVLMVIVNVLTSCVTKRDLKYFQDISDSTQLNSISLAKYREPVIHPSDVLSVSVQTNDPSLTANVNSGSSVSGQGSSASNSGADLSGYMVDSLGFIQMPVLGSLKVGGLTVVQATDVVRQKAKQYFVNPIVIVKNKSFRVTVLGEVSTPGVKYISVPKANILDLLGTTGDLTVGAQRNNVLLMRQNDNNTLSTIRIDLTNTKILRSPYFYLQSNDVIIVEPNKQKAISADAAFARNLSFVTLGLSLFSTFLIIFR